MSEPAATVGDVSRPPTRDRLATGRIGLVVERVLGALTGDGTGRRVLDCGGGSGAIAVPLAAAGAQVTVVDVSADALSTLQRRAAEAGVEGAVTGVPGDIEVLAAVFEGDESFDAVLAHGVLDSVSDPDAVLAAMAARVTPGGVLSVVLANPAAAVLGRALGGEPAAALTELRRLDAPDTVGPDRVVRLAAAIGLTLESRAGVGVFSDLVPGSVGETPGAREAVAQLDAAAAERPPFAEIAARVHLLLRRPGP